MAIEYVEAPQKATTAASKSVFLAGGITDCPNWQSEAYGRFELDYGDEDLVIYNPRRENFPIDDPSAAREQIEWEYKALAAADLALFWFPGGMAIQPIALYELGRHAGQVVTRHAGGRSISGNGTFQVKRPIVVGVDEGYKRSQDVFIQLELARPEIFVHDTLSATVRDAIRALKAISKPTSVPRSGVVYNI
jgi:hypothetical protein